ncbi:MAG: sterol desaturase family protein [Pseudomonadota bacterium]
MTPDGIQNLGASIDEVFLLIGAIMLVIEIVKGLFETSFSGRGLVDIIASISTQIPSVLIETFVLSLAYVGYVYVAETFVTWTLPINIWSIGLALLACDFVYYWEHRVAHEVRIFWTQHAVHHSSRFMNPSVAVRFGPFEGAVSALFYFPLVLLGFPPSLVFFGIFVVLAYQTWIHTELIGKLGVLDEVLNTPANHRVHHGCDDKYIDKNYGGILILWDRLFGTFQREEERPVYGLKRDFHSVNPLVVWVSELPQFFSDLKNARSGKDVWMFIFGKPGWVPDRSRPDIERTNAS